MDNKTKIQYIISFLLLALVVFSYVNQVGSLTQETYLIEKYQEQISNYSQESRSLEYQFLQSNSFFEVENIARELNFEEASKVSYIEVLGSEVVVK